MEKKYITYSCLTVFLLFFYSYCEAKSLNLKRANKTLDYTYGRYGIEGSNLLRETYPFDEKHKATYLANTDLAEQPNQYSYLWPYSGSLSAVTALYGATHNSKYKKLLDLKVLPGLEEYLDNKREPYAYASYVNTAPLSDRFYDDNIWIGIDFTDLYRLTGDKRLLDKALLIWNFIESGKDDLLRGGVYWCEQNKNGKNTCSNAPAAVYALKLFEATNDSSFFFRGKELYDWVKTNLQDTTDYLYFDNINVNGNVDKAKYAYNSGQMLQSASLLYKLTNNPLYLKDAQNIASSAYLYFFHDFNAKNGKSFKLLNKGNVWFTAVMLRGYIELYNIDKDNEYINAFRKNLDYAWKHMRDKKSGLFNSDWSGETKDHSKWLLTQLAMVEMYSRISKLN